MGNKNSKDKNTQVFMGTTVVGGRGMMLVEQTGAATRMGQIAASLREQREEQTPLQRKMAGLARWLAIIVAVIAGGVFLLGLLAGKDPLEMFTIAVAVAVAAIPEGLVVALTAILAIGMQRIYKRKALVRKLVAAETLGSVTVVCADKTGTLTQGRMRVVKSKLVNLQEGVAAALFANAQEDPLELALMEWAKQKLLPTKMKKIAEMPFDPVRKYQKVGVGKDKRVEKVYISGAPEIVLGMCDLDKSGKAEWMKLLEQWASEGLRLVGFAVGADGWEVEASAKTNYSRKKLSWLGVVGIEDPVREEVVETLEKMHKAGIKLKVVTGDYLGTAVAVWRKIKSQSQILTDAYRDEQYVAGANLKAIETTTIFARVTPQEKLALVKALQAAGEIVASFGDGVNDAPALKRADIGVVVNEAADTAKETADMVLLDSNFKTVVAAIEEGRGIYDNIRKVSLYLLSDSFSEIVLILLSLLARIPLPLTAAQILWINLVTDGLPNLALTVEPKEPGLLRRRPENSHRGLLNREMKILIATISGITGVAAFGLFWVFWQLSGSLALARSVTFVMLGVDSLLYVFSVRSLARPFWQIPLQSNPYLLAAVGGGLLLQLGALYLPLLANFLGTVTLGLAEWSIVGAAAALVIVFIEAIKHAYARQQ